MYEKGSSISCYKNAKHKYPSLENAYARSVSDVHYYVQQIIIPDMINYNVIYDSSCASTLIDSFCLDVIEPTNVNQTRLYIGVWAPLSVVIKRSKERGLLHGRFVPEEWIKSDVIHIYGASNVKKFKNLENSPLLNKFRKEKTPNDHVIFIDNGGKEPKIVFDTRNIK